MAYKFQKYVMVVGGLCALIMAGTTGAAFMNRDYAVGVLRALSTLLISFIFFVEVREDAVREFRARQKKMLEFDFDKTKTE